VLSWVPSGLFSGPSTWEMGTLSLVDGMAVTGSACPDSVWHGAGCTLAGSGIGGTGFKPWELWLESLSTGHGFANTVTLIRQACAGRINWRLARLTHFSQYFSSKEV
jgi:hypothetical protein